MLDVFLSCTLPYILKRDLSLNLEVADPARLADDGASGIRLSLLPPLFFPSWGSRCVLLHLVPPTPQVPGVVSCLHSTDFTD